ncbi:ABC transporter permease [Anaerocolumna xylanovorans]|uniref:ABC-2 family transporter protein n=1 Tax=Anaerocolumna xylanovorans DSM 12503 TaxID=1121345 RepID=A0A1M7Y4N9_9FIRM|nr:ABC transporter permease subunit [Anaerocolumna xylanovorans]SHO47141.1 ABC-2 family transporter protein [Anaerocolumna xylanovorans DSM 12503]
MLRLNPVYQKELRTTARSLRTYVIIFAVNGLLSLFGLFALYLSFEYQQKIGNNVEYSAILEIYSIITGVEFFLLLLVVPAVTAGAISGEKERQTLEILLTTKLTPGSIIRGKLVASISMMLLLAFSSLPVIALVFSIGGITLRDLAEFLLLILETAIYLGSIGIFFSALLKKSTSATVAAYGTVLLLCLGTFGAVWGIHFLDQMHLNHAGDTVTAIQADIGNWMLLLLVNPIVTYLSILKGQASTGRTLASLYEKYGNLPEVLNEHWLLFSTVIQIVIAVILLLSAAAILNPLKGNKERIKHKKQNTKKKVANK